MRPVSSIMATSSFDDSDDSGTAVSVYVQNCWMRTATLSRTVWSVYDYHHSVPFSPCSRHVCFMVEIATVSILLQSANRTIVGTRSDTLNGEKGLLFAISCS